MNTAQSQPITISVNDAMSAIGVGRTTLYALINDGSLRTIKVGSKRLVIVASIHTWIARMEAMTNTSNNLAEGVSHAESH